MNASPHKLWTQDEFLIWAETQACRYEFDGMQPVAMTGGTAAHGIIQQNLYTALNNRLRGSSCRVYGPDNGVATVGKAIRYPDALVTCTRQELSARLISDVIVVFEIISPSSGRIDRFVKVREYGAVASIRRYVMIESTSLDLTVMARKEPSTGWLTTTLTQGEILSLPEVGIDLPVAELYADMDLADEEAAPP